eukprot:1719129-Pyramimonas_sp.AAC.1
MALAGSSEAITSVVAVVVGGFFCLEPQTADCRPQHIACITENTNAAQFLSCILQLPRFVSRG